MNEKYPQRSPEQPALKPHSESFEANAYERQGLGVRGVSAASQPGEALGTVSSSEPKRRGASETARSPVAHEDVDRIYERQLQLGER